MPLTSPSSIRIKAVERIRAERINFVVGAFAPIFANNVTVRTKPQQQVPLSIYWSANAWTKLRYTLNGGTNYVKLNSGDPELKDTAYVFTVFVANGDLFNLQSDVACTIHFARVGQQT